MLLFEVSHFVRIFMCLIMTTPAHISAMPLLKAGYKFYITCSWFEVFMGKYCYVHLHIVGSMPQFHPDGSWSAHLEPLVGSSAVGSGRHLWLWEEPEGGHTFKIRAVLGGRWGAEGFAPSFTLSSVFELYAFAQGISHVTLVKLSPKVFRLFGFVSVFLFCGKDLF